MAIGNVKRLLGMLQEVAAGLGDAKHAYTVSELVMLGSTASRIASSVSERLAKEALAHRAASAKLAALTAILNGGEEPPTEPTAEEEEEEEEEAPLPVEAPRVRAEPPGAGRVPEDYDRQVQALLDRYGLTTRELSQALNMVKSTVANWVIRHRLPSEEAWGRFLEYRQKVAAERGEAPAVAEEEEPQAEVPADYDRWVKALMETYHLTRQDLAKGINVSTSTVGNWMTRFSAPSKDSWALFLAYRARLEEARRREVSTPVPEEPPRIPEALRGEGAFVSKAGRQFTAESHARLVAAHLVKEGPFAGMHRMSRATCESCGRREKIFQAIRDDWPLADLCPECARAAEPDEPSEPARRLVLPVVPIVPEVAAPPFPG